MNTGPLVVLVRKRLQSANQHFAQGRQLGSDFFVGKPSPGLPLRVFFGAVAGERWVLLGQNAINPLQKNLMVTGEVGEVLQCRPFAGSRRLKDGFLRNSVQSGVEKIAELGFNAGKTGKIRGVHLFPELRRTSSEELQP